MSEKINKALVSYIEKNYFPIYETFDKGHNLNHILGALRRALIIADEIADESIDMNIVYAATTLHDIGIQIERKNHALHSGEIIRKDENLKQFFNSEEIETIANAAEDHSTSKGVEPRTIYGKIVCDADKDDDLEESLLRAYEYTKNYFPTYTEEECFKNVYNQIVYKFGPEGKVKFWTETSVPQTIYSQMQNLANNEQEFNHTLQLTLEKRTSK